MVEISELVAQELRAPFFKGPLPKQSKTGTSCSRLAARPKPVWICLQMIVI